VRPRIGVVLLGVGGDQDHGSWFPVGVVLELPGDLEAALGAEVDFDQGDVGPQLVGEPERLGAGGRHADARHPLAFEQAAGGVQEEAAVVDDQAAQHAPRMTRPSAGGIPASWPLARVAALRRSCRC